MHEIICPHCHKSFAIDDSAYAEILSQVRDDAFERAVHERLEKAQTDKELAVERAEGALKERFQADVSERDTQIAELKSKLEVATSNHQLQLREALHAIEKERDDLKRQIASKDDQRALMEATLKEKYATQIADRDETIERLRELKSKLSTKMVGESLEQHCEVEFNSVRATAFPNAYFEKDNDASGGSKGDFIFRDYGEDGIEYISVMFEMKNESDTTATKKKNEDFFKELDKDRNEKNCEYAILVSLLESDNELYNRGIVDVSHRFDKMFVVRPQFFVPIIALLRNAAQNTLTYRREIEQMRLNNIDIANFELQIEDFKTKFGENYRLATERFEDAIKEIDKSIAALTKVKENLQLSEKHLSHANNKAEKLTIERLTKDAPSLAAKVSRSSAKAIQAADPDHA